ncbi:hypothetical protein BH09PSE5_BH09PSE5_24370 [soil metagenome]
MSLPQLPKLYTAPNDLTDEDFAALDDAFVNAPVRLMVGDAVMLDGYLCGVLVQPKLIEQEEWLSRVFEADDGIYDEPADGAAPDQTAAPAPQLLHPEWVDRVTPLIIRRYAALNRNIVEEGSFDPFILEFDEDAAVEPDADAEADDEFAALNPISRTLAPWVLGFQLACVHFEGLLETTDEAAMLALARLFRHLPPNDEQMADLIATMDKESPIDTLDEGIDELVACVIDLSDLMSNERYRVDTVRRETPKVGRNEPCPCGSGKKYKQCHGAG